MEDSYPSPQLVLTALEQLRAKIAQGWCQGASALNADGESAAFDPDSAVRWCLTGGIDTVVLKIAAPYGDWRLVYAVYVALGFTLEGELVRWNDESDRTQADVVVRIDAALATARAALPAAPSDT